MFSFLVAFIDQVKIFFYSIQYVYILAFIDTCQHFLSCFLCDRELYSNNISGRVPNELGNLTNLVSLDLYLNKLNGPIPDTLRKLQKLRFLYAIRIY